MRKKLFLNRFGGMVVVLCVALLASVRLAPSASAAPAPKRIEITAKRFEYAPSEVTLKKGEPVVLVLKAIDVAHGVKFEALGLKTDIGKGSQSELAFTPDKVGTYVGHCSHFCGSGHGSMTLTLHVTE